MKSEVRFPFKRIALGDATYTYALQMDLSGFMNSEKMSINIWHISSKLPISFHSILLDSFVPNTVSKMLYSPFIHPFPSVAAESRTSLVELPLTTTSTN